MYAVLKAIYAKYILNVYIAVLLLNLNNPNLK